MAEYNPSKIIKDGNTYNFRDTTKIPLSGSNAISGSLIPATTNAYDLGSSSYQWNNAYIKSLTINGVACGDILTHNVSEFVDVTSAQTIGGRKIFSDGVTGIGRDLYHFAIIPYGKNTPPANMSLQYIWFSGNSASQGIANSWYGGYIEQAMYTDGSARGRWAVRRTDETIASVEIFAPANNTLTFRPSIVNSMQLGDNIIAWKDCYTNAINGIEPSALSLPGDTYINIDTTNYAWGSNFTFTPDYNGHCFINIGFSANSKIISIKTGRGEYYFSNQTDIFRFTFPVYKGKLVTIWTKSSGTESVIPTIRLFPCQGNV